MMITRPGRIKEQRLDHASAVYQKRCGIHVLQQLFWECTLRCNLRCAHCGSDCRESSAIDDMPLEDFLIVLDDVRSVMDSRLILVNTTGGEPLMRKDICDCGKAIRERGFHWGMVTNGMLLDETMCDRLIDAGLETVTVSLDGFEHAHNWFRGHPRSFIKAEDAIKSLADRGILWDVITCVNQRNFGSLIAFRDHLINTGVKRWRIFTVAPMGRAVNNEELQLTDEQFGQLMDFIVESRQEGIIQVSYGCEGFLGNYEWAVRRYPFFCQAGINVASVLADGSISGCLSIRSDYHQGNIYEDRFTDVWANGFECYRQREWMHTGECASCDMWKYCKGNGMHLRGDDGQTILCHMKRLKETEK